VIILSLAQLRNHAYDPGVEPIELRDPDHYRRHAEICRVLTDPKRLMLLDALRTGPAAVGTLADAIGVSLPNASQHLAVLRNAGLVEGRRNGTSIAYELVEPAIVEACRIIDGIVEHRTNRIAHSASTAAVPELPPAAVPLQPFAQQSFTPHPEVPRA